MNLIHQCFQNISPGNFSYVRDVRMYVCTDKGDTICPPPHYKLGGGGHKNIKYDVHIKTNKPKTSMTSIPLIKPNTFPTAFKAA